MTNNKRAFRWIKTLLRSTFRPPRHTADSSMTRIGDGALYPDVFRNAEKTKELLVYTEDLVIRELAHNGKVRALAIYISSAASTKEVAKHVIQPILHTFRLKDQIDEESHQKINPWEAVTAGKITTATNFQEVTDSLTEGRCVLFVPGETIAQIIWLQGWRGRKLEAAHSEPATNGPIVGFNEDLSDKISLIRQRLRTEKLRVENFVVGVQSNTPVSMVYLENVARDEIVQEARRRIRSIHIDGIVDINYIKELLLDEPLSPWPNFLVTERPDRAVAHILEGQIVVMIHGSPWVLILPITIDSLLQSPDDYYLHFYIGSFTRALRWFSTGIALAAPSLYVALLSFHHELIPSGLLFTILASREHLPLPPFLEALLMELAFEILREAGLRMPQQVGPALSIVGGLVIGEAAVRAGLVSTLMIVVVGMTAIATFVIPSRDFGNAIRILRFPTLISAALLGLFGILMFVMFITALMVRARSFGVPMLSPLVPVWTKGLGDSLIRSPWWGQRYRPWHMVKPDQITSEPTGKKPDFGPLHDDKQESDPP